MELNAEQIIEGLEFFHHRILHTSLAKKIYEAEIMAITDAILLIKELTEKVENYRNELGEVRVALAEANNDKKKLTEENERLRVKGAEWRGCADTLFEEIKKAKADTAREIFKEIESFIVGNQYGEAKILVDKFLKIKKKYTEDNGNDI